MDLARFVCLVSLLASLKLSRGQLLECRNDQWQCDDGDCIPDFQRCDGDGDCWDGSDEMDCTGLSECPQGQFPCRDSVGCVNVSARCDGQIQCPTGSDEENCPPAQGCLESDWTCHNHICIPKEQRCNGLNDCLDNSDEESCGQCGENGVRCPEGTCLSSEERCDGQIHCSDGSDEPITCGRICSLNNGGCSHLCADEAWGSLCSCPVGYKLSPNGAVCEDLDECAPPAAPCMHHCTNTVGSYYCYCRDGFKLDGNSTCVVKGGAVKLLAVQRRSVGLVNVKSRHFDVVQTSVSDPVTLTFDVARGLFFWANNLGNIYKSDGQQTSMFFSGEPGITGLACDWLTGNLFWANQRTESIYMQAADGSSYAIVLSKYIRPSDLVLLPVESLMFWINGGREGRMTLEKSWMDGSDKSSLVVLTAQEAHGLTADVAARRLYWISDFKKSIETVKTDGSGRDSFTGFFSRRRAVSLAVFDASFFWVDEVGLWQVPQDLPEEKRFLSKAELPVIAVYHEQQQPQGSSACTNAPCQLCQLTKANPSGFKCTCPRSKVLLFDGICEYPRFIYATMTDINMVEFKGTESPVSQLFTTEDGILSFDLDWNRDWLYWANQTGHIQRTSLSQVKTEVVPTPVAVCVMKVDQRRGNLFWVSCDQKIIGMTTADEQYTQQLYQTAGEVQDLYLDWLGGVVLWLEEERIFAMSMMGGKPTELLQLARGDSVNIAFDVGANTLLWNSKGTGLTALGLLLERSHQASRRWNITGSILAASEPFLLTRSNDVMTLWDRRDGSAFQSISVGGQVFGVVAALSEVRTVPVAPVCAEPSVWCRYSSVCLPQAQLCDGKKDCPQGEDEDFCVTTCPSKEDFRCRDGGRCISHNLVCDGRSHCGDGSDEISCPTITSTAAHPNILKCRTGSKLCGDGTECVLHSHVCDGEEDCQDGSDERECDAKDVTVITGKLKIEPSNKILPATKAPVLMVPTCSSPWVLCPQSSLHLCISPRQFCDGQYDCPDGFDEQNCVQTCLSNSDFHCKDRRRCISRSLVCDGHSHCFDSSDEINCPSIAPPAIQPSILRCRMGSRPCEDGTECVLHSHVCDGEWDCRDRSDEVGCGTTTEAKNVIRNESPPPVKPFTKPPTKPSCTSPSYLCPGSSVCISPTQLCDGKNDCSDGSDEKCLKRCPYMTDFLCKDRMSCVSSSLVCDGRSHCFDGSDEVTCPSIAPPAVQTSILMCHVGSKPCENGQDCVLQSDVCDGKWDCRDGSDEVGCEKVLNESPPPVELFTENPTEPSCTGSSYLCPGSSLCISPAQFCDGRNDCSDGSDEECLTKCPHMTDFLCKNHRSCVSRSLVCDGSSHCLDGSDEINCPSKAPPAVQPSILKCRVDAKPCNDGTECVLHSHVCDGEWDCRDGSDEAGCPGKCKQGEFQCAHGKMCIPATQLCDGKPQCRDYSDELSCRAPSRSCEHHCTVGSRCIPKNFLCDGERDCPDGSDEVGCEHDSSATSTTESPVFTSALTCVSPSVLCPGASKCISENQLCDGRKDCPDGSDERNCEVQCKNTDDFLCSDQTACVPRSKVCDGQVHCPDGSDEKMCRSAASTALPPSSTRAALLKCGNGFTLCSDSLECVMYSHVCDGEEDCSDGSDEKGCASQCKEAEFQCAHGKRCIPKAQVCDGQNDCQDRSDEMNCQRVMEGCHLRCDNDTRCIPHTFLCDGEKDCADGSDEEKCGLEACAALQYRCASGQCVSEGLRCDGYADCSDRSDEVDCMRPPRCPTQLRCPNSHECLQREWICDGEKDCKDGWDEQNCTSPPVKCREYQWQCGDGSQCIPLSWRCDWNKDCRNGMDEDKCSLRKCPSHLYQCGSGECMDPGLVCNGVTNCADRSDEGVGCVRRNCSGLLAPRCEHRCVSTPNGPRCYCSAGFRLHPNAVSCVDINECSSTPHAVCKHTCTNTPGSYTCQCYPGFYLEPDNKSCKTKDEPVLLASVQSELLLLGVHSGSLSLLSSASRPVFSLDYHWAQQRVYWLSPDYQSIRWTDMKSPDSKGTLIKGVKSDFIAVDWVGKNLYWVDGLVGQILAVKLSDTTLRSQDFTVVLGEDLEQPSSLVLLPHMGVMLWSEIGSSPQIEYSGMDGSKRKVVVNRSLSWPVSLAYDFVDDRVYWADEKLRCIGSTSLDGGDIKILQLAETPSPFSVAIFNDRVFWSDTKRRTIRSADKYTGKDQKVLLKRPGQPFGLKLMHVLSQQSTSSNPCDPLHCSHLCLLAPAVRTRSRFGAPAVLRPSAVCRCPKGMMLSKDKVTCTLPVESSFILLLSRATIYQIYLHSIGREGVALKKMPTSKVLPLPDFAEASLLDASIQGLSVYVADAAQGTVDVLKLGGSRSRQGLMPVGQILKLTDDSVMALAVDWVTSNLYWSSSQKPSLHVTSPLGSYTTLLLQGALKGTASVALHPPSGRLCYTAVMAVSGKSQAEVNCAWMDGRNKVVLWTRSSLPTSVAFSDQGSVIYWADTVEGVISSIGVDGLAYKEFKTGPGLLGSFTRTENMLFWVTLDKDITKVWLSDGLQPNQLWFETKTSVVGVKAFSVDSQTGTNSCSNDNGGCSQLCLPFPGGRTCTCGQGFSLVSDTSCSALPRCPAGHQSCSDGSQCVSSSMFCDGHVDCHDQSDEQDCPNSDSSQTKAVESPPPPPPASSSSTHPDSEEKTVLSVKESVSCDLQRCHGHGRCITEGRATRCQCLSGFRGEFCEESETGRSHAPTVLPVLCLVILLMAAAFLFIKRRGCANIGSRSLDKQTLMANMGLPAEQYDSDTEELDSPVDAKNPPLTLKSLQLKYAD